MRKSLNSLIRNKKVIIQAQALVMAALPSLSAASIIDFETLPDLVSITNQYTANGINFNNAIALTAGFSLNEIDYPPSSGNVAIGDDSAPLEIHFSSSTQNISAHFTYGSQLTFKAYDFNGNLLSTFINSGLNNLGASELISLSFTGVGSLTIQGTEINSFIMDDLSYTSQPSVVPLPGALISFASGLMGLSLTRRKKLAKNNDSNSYVMK